MARTDNDSWDLASGVGATATMVAAQRVLADREGLIDDPYAEPLVRAVGLDFFTRALDGEFDLEDVDPRFNKRRAAEGMTVRTRHFDGLFADAADAGVRQAVILASGLDARAYRLPWPDGTVAIDLRDDWPKALLDNGFDSGRPTAWTAEGLLIYLPSEAQDLLFDRITELSAAGSRVATEHIPDVSMFSDGRAKEITDRLKTYGHDFEMGDLIYHGERSDVLDYLTAHGWDVSAQGMRDAYDANGFEFPEDGALGFFADLSYVTAIK